MSGLSERDVERLAEATRDALHHWDAEATVSPPEAVARTVAPVVAAIRDEAKAEALREAADEWETTEPLNHTYAHVKFFARELRNRAALLDGGDQS